MTTPTDTWQTALADLELQLPKTAYDTWLSTTTLISHDDGAYIIGASSAAAVECLSGSLLPAIKRTLSRISRQPVTVEFQVGANGSCSNADPDPTPDAPDAYVQILDFDPLSRGYQITPAYSVKFWLPLLDAPAFNSYQVLRAWYYSNSDWTRYRAVYMELLANTVGVGLQTLTGRPGHRGQIYRLEDQGIARITVTGNTKTRQYYITVRNTMPLLTPDQVGQLKPLLRKEHGRFLQLAAIDQEEWQQLKLPIN